jgi:hypothetical protein
MKIYSNIDKEKPPALFGSGRKRSEAKMNGLDDHGRPRHSGTAVDEDHAMQERLVAESGRLKSQGKSSNNKKETALGQLIHYLN